MSKPAARLSKARMYDVIIAPVITEKANMGAERNQVTFRVPLKASKPEIKMAIEGLFDVRVKAVNTLIRKGKTKQFRGRYGKQSDVKRAIVTLIEGYSIDAMIGT
ncbi:LSU ribosomal protein L23p (L23Ae) [invertebrate metagenome]|uniref:LSU ribosomal protein L23p (L23Ae) n=1 Tax=invertebrate metagenome TaxID=1711999 RepID=A0A484H764_9ZZZZ